MSQFPLKCDKRQPAKPRQRKHLKLAAMTPAHAGRVKSSKNAMGRRNMEHVAIMRKSWGLTEKILTGQKKIESRWYSVKYKPWNSIKKGEAVYFKDSGEPVRIKAEVSKVIQFADLTPKRVREILDEYGKDDGIGAGKNSRIF